MKKRETMVWPAVLALSWVVGRYVLFPLHGMRDWPTVLFAVGAVIMGAAACLRGRWTVRAAACGYLPGAILAVLTFRESFDPGGGRLSNLWLIWTAAYLVLILAGAAADVVGRKRKR